jgi:hypothetical protein
VFRRKPKPVPAPIVRKWSRWAHEKKGRSKAAQGLCSVRYCQATAQWSRVWPKRSRWDTWQKAMALCDVHGWPYLNEKQRKAGMKTGVRPA